MIQQKFWLAFYMQILYHAKRSNYHWMFVELPYMTKRKLYWLKITNILN